MTYWGEPMGLAWCHIALEMGLSLKLGNQQQTKDKKRLQRMLGAG
jgi:hypothetical protein